MRGANWASRAHSLHRLIDVFIQTREGAAEPSPKSHAAKPSNGPCWKCVAKCWELLKNQQEPTRINKQHQMAWLKASEEYLEVKRYWRQQGLQNSQSTAHLHRKTIRTTTRSHCYSLQGLLTLLIRINVDKIDRYAQTCRDVQSLGYLQGLGAWR